MNTNQRYIILKFFANIVLNQYKQHHPNTHTNHQPKRSNQHPKAVRSIQSKEGKCVRIVSGSKKKPVAMTGLILYN